MEKMKPYAVDDSSSFESLVMGDVKAGFPSPSEDIREKLGLSESDTNLSIFLQKLLKKQGE